MVIKNMVNGFLKCFDELKSEGLISHRSLKKYWIYNVHSYLQYCLVMSGHREGFRGVPEYKLRLAKPIDRYLIDSRLRNRRIRYMKTIRVDIGFLKGGKLVGVGEVYTPDEIHGCLPTRELDEAWITPYHKLMHIAEHEEDIELIILVVGLWTLPSWRDARRKTPQEWRRDWEKLINRLSSKKQVGAVYIEELDKVESTP